VRDLAPEFQTALFQPGVQRCEIGEVRHRLPQARPGILNVLLNLAFLPARSRIAELRFIDVVVRHGEKAHVDLALLAATHPIYGCLHVVIDAALRHAAKDAEPMPVGIEQHLMRLQQIGENGGAKVGHGSGGMSLLRAV